MTETTSKKIVWERETNGWIVTEYEKEPQFLNVTLLHKDDDDFSCHFGSLGIEGEKLDRFDDNTFNCICWFIASNATGEGWNVSVSSFWSSVQFYVPDAESYQDMWGEDEDFDPEILKMLTTVWEMIDSEN